MKKEGQTERAASGAAPVEKKLVTLLKRFSTLIGLTTTPPAQRTVAVGTGVMVFQSCSAATFSYNFTGGSSSGGSGTINLSRVGPVPPGCTT